MKYKGKSDILKTERKAEWRTRDILRQEGRQRVGTWQYIRRLVAV